MAFTASNLCKVYKTGETEVHALRGVDLTIATEEVVVLLGPSGSGKSTLLNIIGGLDRPTSGTLHYGDEELTGLGDAELTRFRRDHVGFIFQFYNLVPSLTAEGNVRLVTDIADNPMPPTDALAMVGLADRKDHFPAQLSGGEQQRVAVPARSPSSPRSCCATSRQAERGRHARRRLRARGRGPVAGPRGRAAGRGREERVPRQWRFLLQFAGRRLPARRCLIPRSR
jgi:predicted ABC-type transport system involved in lysophospholipase L1 biosynthesis ATPase subunit